MAKESMKAREVKREKLVARYAEKRAALKKIIATTENPAEAYEAARKLQAIPKNANPIRLHNRCKITGRPKGYIRQFGISRIQFREMASQGLIPGIKKASWQNLYGIVKACQSCGTANNLDLYRKIFLILSGQSRLIKLYIYDRSNSRLSDKIEECDYGTSSCRGDSCI